jgi:thiosulfate/3-mercaptopyruvate sulfurtransferase
MARRDEVLKTPAWLESRLGDRALRVFDCSVHLGADGAVAGRDVYDAGHVPGAAFLDLLEDLSDPASELAFTRPPPARLAESLSNAGISREAPVVLYSGTDVMWATRAWWILRWAGAEDVSVLDGGLGRWQAEDRAVSTEPARYPAARFEPALRDEIWASKSDVLAAIDDGGVCTLDALPEPIHRGDVNLGYARPGHIKGSANLSFMRLVDRETGGFLPDADLRKLFSENGSLEKGRVISYCGGGIAATANAFVLGILGQDSVSVYDGSLNEWARDPELPMETGDSD